MVEAGAEASYTQPAQLRVALADLAKPLATSAEFGFRKTKFVRDITTRRPSVTTVSEAGVAKTEKTGEESKDLTLKGVLQFLYSHLGIAQESDAGLSEVIDKEVVNYRTLAEGKTVKEMRVLIGEIASNSQWRRAFDELDAEIRDVTNSFDGVLVASRYLGDFIVNQSVALMNDAAADTA